VGKRRSALADKYPVGRFGLDEGEVGVRLQDVKDLQLYQVGTWPDLLGDVGRLLSNHVGADTPPKPCRSVRGTSGILLRVEPLKWWLLEATPPSITPQDGALLDISHSRTRVRISGPSATDLLNRHIPIDLRDASFPEGAVASSAFHYVGVTVWRSSTGFELFLPRGFALSLWEMLLDSAMQFGVEVI